MASYVCSRALGFVLLFLLPLVLGNEDDNLLNIINKLHETYGSDNNQYALAINVPAKYCEQGAELNWNFLSRDSEQNVKNDMNGPNRVYIGNELIAAKPRKIDETNNNCHSEYLLLGNSLMENLLNKDKQGCTVFFTLNSPCVKTCSTPNTRYSIIPGLKIFRNHRGTKAFVFRQVWHFDTTCDNNLQWEENIKTIDEILPVYLCFKNKCVRCVDRNRVNVMCTINVDDIPEYIQSFPEWELNNNLYD